MSKSKRAKTLPFRLNVFCTCFAFDHVFTVKLTPKSGRKQVPKRWFWEVQNGPFWAPILSTLFEPFSDLWWVGYIGPFCPRSVPGSPHMGPWIDTTCHHHAPMVSACEYLIWTTKKGVQKSSILVDFYPFFQVLTVLTKPWKPVLVQTCNMQSQNVPKPCHCRLMFFALFARFCTMFLHTVFWDLGYQFGTPFLTPFWPSFWGVQNGLFHVCPAMPP